MALSLAIVVSSCGSENEQAISADAVATVGRQNIDKERFERIRRAECARIKVLGSDFDPGVRQECRTEPQRGKAKMMSLVLEGSMFTQEAKRLGIPITDRVLDRYVATSWPTHKAYETTVAKSGLSERDFRYALRGFVAQQNVVEEISSRVEVDSKSVAAFYARNTDRYTSPPNWEVKMVVTRSRKMADLVRAKRERGADWAELARRYTINEKARVWGGRTFYTRGSNDGPIDYAVFKARLGKLIGPVKDNGRWYVFELVGTTPAKTPTLAEVRKEITASLAEEQRGKRIAALNAAIVRRYKPTCAAEYAVPPCVNAPERDSAPN